MLLLLLLPVRAFRRRLSLLPQCINVDLLAVAGQRKEVGIGIGIVVRGRMSRLR
jgi:hypothetical protein